MEKVKEWDGIGITRGMHITCSSRYAQQGSELFICRSDGYWKTNLSCTLKRNMGCFENSRTALVLEVSKFLDINGEQECESYCLEQNIRKYFGLQYGKYCYCGTDIKNSPKRMPDEECSTPCRGNEQEFCGGDWRISIFLSA
eukprot:XP_019919386.1 PREDICTED: xylosyltransferase oxt-like [Crassostrea gigas]